MSRLLVLPPAMLVLILLGCGQPAAEVAQTEKPPAVEQPAPKPPAPKPAPGEPPEKVIVTTVEKGEELPEKDLTIMDPGLDSKIEAALPEIERLDKTVDTLPPENIGAPPGIGLDDPPPGGSG